MKPLCYISSPYTEGDQLGNAAYAMGIIKEMVYSIVIPLSPLSMAAMQLVVGWSHGQWMEYDLALLSRCQCVLVCGDADMVSRSVGVQAEIKFALENGIPVFYNFHDLITWARGRG
jgi:hypothetical protein